MKKKTILLIHLRRLYPYVLHVALCLLMFVSCTNSDYDFDQVDLTLGFGGGQLALPVDNSTSEIILEDLLEIESTDLVNVESNGDYVFGKAPEMVAPVNVTIEHYTLLSAGYDGSTVDIELPEALRPLAGQTIDVSAWNIMLSGKVAELSYEYEIPEAVRTLDYLGLGWNDSSVGLTVRVMLSDAVKRFEYVEINLPKQLEMTLMTQVSGVVYDAGNNRLRLENYQYSGSIDVSFNVTRINIGRADDGNLAEVRNGHLYLKGTVDVSAKVSELTIPTSNRISAAGEITFNDVVITSAYGVFDPEINMTEAGTIDITAIPNFLTDQEVVVDLDNPQIWLTVRSTLPLGGTVKALLRSDTYPQGILLDTEDRIIRIKSSSDGETEVETNVLLCRHRPSGIGDDIQVIEDDNLSKLVNTLQEGMRLEFITSEVRAAQQPGLVRLGYPYHLTPGYRFTAPLAFGPNAVIIYRKTYDGWHEDLDGLALSEGGYLHITGTAVNRIPVNLELEITPVDVNGNVIDDLSVEHIRKYAAGSKGEGAESPLEVKVTDRTGKGISRLDGMILKLKGLSNDELCGMTLNKNTQTLVLKDINVEIVGKIIYDAN